MFWFRNKKIIFWYAFLTKFLTFKRKKIKKGEEKNRSLEVDKVYKSTKIKSKLICANKAKTLKGNNMFL